jgi:uncharacterized protein YjbI with pentapeptide repeats
MTGADRLEEFDELDPGDDLVAFQAYDGVAVDGREFTDLNVGNMRLLECRFRRTGLERCDLTRTAFVDCTLEDVRLVGTVAANSQWRDSALRASLLAGTDLAGSQLRRVTIIDCKLETVNLRGADLREVVFEGCTVAHLDLGEATLDRCVFRDCRLSALDLTKASLTGTDFRTSQLDVHRGHLSLAGATIDVDQLLGLAPGIATELGIDVRPAG